MCLMLMFVIVLTPCGAGDSVTFADRFDLINEDGRTVCTQKVHAGPSHFLSSPPSCDFRVLQDREVLRHLQQPRPLPLRLSPQQPLADR